VIVSKSKARKQAGIAEFVGMEPQCVPYASMHGLCTIWRNPHPYRIYISLKNRRRS